MHGSTWFGLVFSHCDRGDRRPQPRRAGSSAEGGHAGRDGRRSGGRKTVRFLLAGSAITGTDGRATYHASRVCRSPPLHCVSATSSFVVLGTGCLFGGRADRHGLMAESQLISHNEKEELACLTMPPFHLPRSSALSSLLLSSFSAESRFDRLSPSSCRRRHHHHLHVGGKIH